MKPMESSPANETGPFSVGWAGPDTDRGHSRPAWPPAAEPCAAQVLTHDRGPFPCDSALHFQEWLRWGTFNVLSPRQGCQNHAVEAWRSLA